MGFPTSSACGNKPSWFFTVLMIRSTAWWWSCPPSCCRWQNCKVDTSQNHQNGICLKSVMLSNKNIRICHRYRHPEIFGVSFFNTRRRPPLSDPYLPTIDELIWVQINSGSWKKVTHLTQAKRRFARHGDLFMKPWWYIPYSMLQVCHIYLQCGLNLW